MSRLHPRAARAARSLKEELNAAGLTDISVKPGSGPLHTWVEVTVHDLDPDRSSKASEICRLHQVGAGSANGRPQVSRVTLRNLMSQPMKHEIHRALLAQRLELPTHASTEAVFAGNLMPEFWTERSQSPKEGIHNAQRSHVPAVPPQG